jgi:Protein of unknown function (DUF2851)
MSPHKLPEKFLSNIWKNQSNNKEFKTNDGKKIQIIDPGNENIQSDGPDFKNARIRINDITFQGDIEIDSLHSDWKEHGHIYNKKYNKVILHVIFSGDHKHNYVISRDGRKIPTIGLDSLMAPETIDSIQEAIFRERNERLYKIPCNKAAGEINEEFKLKYLQSLGIERFKKKCERILQRLKELVYLKELNIKEPVVQYELNEKFLNRTFTHEDFNDSEIWEQVLYEFVFEALGYTSNKDIMKRIAQSVDIRLLKKNLADDGGIEMLESLFLNVSGLVPPSVKYEDEETTEYIRKLIENWDSIKGSYDNKIFKKSQWNFGKLRPLNFPTIRLAGGIRLLNKLLKEDLVKNILLKLEDINDIKKIARYLRDQIVVKGDGYWHKHFMFDDKAKSVINYFIGVARADDIIVNVILPYSSIYFELFGKKDVTNKIFKIYLNYFQKSESRLVNDISKYLAVERKQSISVYHQGIINLYRNFCSQNKCLNCEIGKKVFN